MIMFTYLRSRSVLAGGVTSSMATSIVGIAPLTRCLLTETCSVVLELKLIRLVKHSGAKCTAHKTEYFVGLNPGQNAPIAF